MVELRWIWISLSARLLLLVKCCYQINLVIENSVVFNILFYILLKKYFVLFGICMFFFRETGSLGIAKCKCCWGFKVVYVVVWSINSFNSPIFFQLKKFMIGS